MTTQTEALKMALEALEDNQHLVADNERHTYVMEYNDLIEKCKEALAQQCVCGEPNSAGTHRTDGPCIAPQRTWVGLTNEERSEIAGIHYARTNPLITATEAKLKEKNT